jgi:RNA-directed DNA polymerase
VTKCKETKRYDITQCVFYKCRNKKRLAKILMIDFEELNNPSSVVKYYSFSVGKKDGDKRSITAPKHRLKSIQKRILRLLRNVQRPEWLISGERGKSYITNGQMHVNSDYLLTMDIKKFYDNCKREYVYRFFVDTMKTSHDIAEILADIVTFNRGIPTGCPTSQVLAYYAYQDMFINIHSIAQKHNCIFTLYVDDMTFSSETPFNPRQLMNSVDIELRRFGHKLKYKKVKYYSKGKHKLVTGVVVSKNHNLLIPNRLHENIYKGTKHVKKLMVNKENIGDQEFIKSSYSLQGRVQAARNVEKSIFPEVKVLAERAVDMALLSSTLVTEK